MLSTRVFCYDGRGNSMSEPPYLTYSRYLRERHGCTVYRVAVDAGFSCPNRAGGRSSRGCTYCAEDGARAPYLGSRESLKNQVESAMSFLRARYDAEAFILFFQAFSNTNAEVGALRQIYDSGLELAPFRGLNVATRPDCIDEEKAALLASYKERGLEVWVELGLQSACESTLRRIERGHSREDFVRAYGLLKERGLKVAVHLIFGLPGEGFEPIMDTIDTVARLDPDGVKIHNLHIPAGTVLATELSKGELTVPSPQRHLEYVIAAIERLPARTVIMRLTCDTPAERLIAPRDFWPKGTFTARVAAEMRARGARQGRLFTAAVSLS
ncbi:MAG: TIGR01212 family radical SAM protein [Spirochaetia bacterium]